MTDPEHDVRHDTAGWGSRPRLTCYSPPCQGATLDAQPYMTQDVWDSKVAGFMATHPCTVLACADSGGREIVWSEGKFISKAEHAGG